MTNYLFLFRPEGHPDFDVFYDVFGEFFGEENPLTVQWDGELFNEYFDDELDCIVLDRVVFFDCIIPNANQERLWESHSPHPFTPYWLMWKELGLPNGGFNFFHLQRQDDDGTPYEMLMAKEIE